MENTYFELIEQTYYVPQEGFDAPYSGLTFYGVSLKYLLEKHGTPFRCFCLAKIGDQIKKTRYLFNSAPKNRAYKRKHHFCQAINEALKHKVNPEILSLFAISLIQNLEEQDNWFQKCLTL